MRFIPDGFEGRCYGRWPDGVAGVNDEIRAPGLLEIRGKGLWARGLSKRAANNNFSVEAQPGGFY